MIIVADSGSTKTDWIFWSEDGNYHQIQTIGLNPYYIQEKEMTDVILKEVVPYTSNVQSIHFYGAGVTLEKQVIVEGAIRGAFGSTIKAEAKSDILGAARATCEAQKAVVCISGTGSNACLFDEGKITAQAPSLGIWLGDEGSAGHIGKLFIQSYLHRDLPAEILSDFETTFPDETVANIKERVYRQPFPNVYLASFTKFVYKHIGNDYCKQLVFSSFDAFFRLSILPLMTDKHVPVFAVGSTAFHFKEVWQQVAIQYDITHTKIIASPIQALAAYHATSK